MNPRNYERGPAFLSESRLFPTSKSRYFRDLFREIVLLVQMLPIKTFQSQV